MFLIIIFPESPKTLKVSNGPFLPPTWPQHTLQQKYFFQDCTARITIYLLPNWPLLSCRETSSHNLIWRFQYISEGGLSLPMEVVDNINKLNEEKVEKWVMAKSLYLLENGYFRWYILSSKLGLLNLSSVTSWAVETLLSAKILESEC